MFGIRAYMIMNYAGNNFMCMYLSMSRMVSTPLRMTKVLNQHAICELSLASFSKRVLGLILSYEN